MIDEALFWSLAGPSGFMDDVADTTLSQGLVAVQAPLYRATGMTEAMVHRLEEEGISPVHLIPSNSSGPMIHRFSATTGESALSIRTAGALLDQPTLRGCAFVIEDIRRSEWEAWTTFFRSFAAERRRRQDEPLLPVLVAMVPNNAPVSDLDRLFPKALLKWSGRVSSFDMRTYVSRRTGRSLGMEFLDKVAIEVAIGLAGYDPRLAEYLISLDPVSAIDPWLTLKNAYRDHADVRPFWGNGLVDTLDGDVHIHTASILAADDRNGFDVRRWRAVSGTVFDFNATVCRHFADTHHAKVDASLPWRVPVPHRPDKLITNRYAMESRHLRDCLEGILEEHEVRFLKQAAKARNDIAHNEVPEGSLIRTLSETWKTYTPSDKKETVGWNWPRCGQKLILMVGPSGAGKSTYAGFNYAPDEIVSADAIRLEIHGKLVHYGPHEEIFKEAIRRLTANLASGKNAVLDATNIRKKDRLKIVDLVPPDMTVEYVVIDRDMEDKQRDGGWRNDRERLLEGHAEIFEGEIAAILTGDDRPNVVVKDIRQSAKAVSLAS